MPNGAQLHSLKERGFCYLNTPYASSEPSAALFIRVQHLFTQQRAWLNKQLATANNSYLGFRPAGYEKSLLHKTSEPCEQFKIGYYLQEQSDGLAGNEALQEYNPLQGDLTVARCWRELGALSKALFGYLASTAGVPPHTTQLLARHPFHQLGLNHYPHHAQQIAQEMLLGSHRDASLLTIILPSAAGLQIACKDHGWRDLPPADNAVIVLVGQFLAELSGHYFNAPLHRVIGIGSEDRYSVVYKYRANRNAKVRLANGEYYCPGALYEKKLRAIMH